MSFLEECELGLVAVWAEVIPNLDSFGIEKIIRITLSEHSFSINGVHLVYMLIHNVDHFTYEEREMTFSEITLIFN